MDENFNKAIELHSAGATVRHKSNFEDLNTHRNEFKLNQEFLIKWVGPFYMEIGNYDDNDWVESIKQIHSEVTPEITLCLLGDFNWRTRLVGAYLSAIKNYSEQIEIIGTHFLKSEVCCVGHIYALIFAFYNNEKSIKYLTDYLEYYLQKPELYFDQESALKSLKYLDKINGTNYSENFLQAWIKLQYDRNILSKQKAVELSKFLEKQETMEIPENKLIEMVNNSDFPIEIHLDLKYTECNIKLMNELREYCC